MLHRVPKSHDNYLIPYSQYRLYAILYWDPDKVVTIEHFNENAVRLCAADKG